MKYDLRKRLLEAAKEAQAIARGEADPATYTVHIPGDAADKAPRKVESVQTAARYRKASAR